MQQQLPTRNNKPAATARIACEPRPPVVARAQWLAEAAYAIEPVRLARLSRAPATSHRFATVVVRPGSQGTPGGAAPGRPSPALPALLERRARDLQRIVRAH